MIDARVKKLAWNLIFHSLKVQPGEKVLIETRGIDPAFVSELVMHDDTCYALELNIAQPVPEWDDTGSYRSPDPGRRPADPLRVFPDAP